MRGDSAIKKPEVGLLNSVFFCSNTSEVHFISITVLPLRRVLIIIRIRVRSVIDNTALDRAVAS